MNVWNVTNKEELQRFSNTMIINKSASNMALGGLMLTWYSYMNVAKDMQDVLCICLSVLYGKTACNNQWNAYPALSTHASLSNQTDFNAYTMSEIADRKFSSMQECLDKTAIYTVLAFKHNVTNQAPVHKQIKSGNESFDHHRMPWKSERKRLRNGSTPCIRHIEDVVLPELA